MATSNLPHTSVLSVEEKKMEVGGATSTTTSSSSSPQSKPLQWSLLLLLNATLMVLGTGGPLLLRVYFLHGGKRMWLSSFTQICGWPLLFLPLSLSYFRRRRQSGSAARLVLLTPPLAAACAGIGLLIGLDCYLYSFGSSYLPLSTSSLLVSSQLAFTAVFAFIVVRQRFTAYSINSVVLLTLGPVVLSLHTGGDRPAGETRAQYCLGFFMTLAAAALIGLALPLMELTCMRAKQAVTYALVMEMQFVMGFAGTALTLVGMVANKDFQAISREAREYRLGEFKYYMVLVWGSIFWQFLNVGLIGLISGASSLLGGILVAVLLPFAEILSVIFFHEKFDGNKGVALALCLWGFASYLYGEMKQNMKLKKTAKEVEATSIIP